MTTHNFKSETLIYEDESQKKSLSCHSHSIRIMMNSTMTEYVYLIDTKFLEARSSSCQKSPMSYRFCRVQELSFSQNALCEES